MTENVFISYSRVDAQFVSPIVKLLRIRQGMVFQDQDTIEPGTKWRDGLEQGLTQATLIVLFWCEHAYKSDEVRKEYESALSKGKNVLPLLLDSTPLPLALTEYQCIDFRGMASNNHAVARKYKPMVFVLGALALTFLGLTLSAGLVSLKTSSVLGSVAPDISMGAVATLTSGLFIVACGFLLRSVLRRSRLGGPGEQDVIAAAAIADQIEAAIHKFSLDGSVSSRTPVD